MALALALVGAGCGDDSSGGDGGDSSASATRGDDDDDDDGDETNDDAEDDDGDTAGDDDDDETDDDTAGDDDDDDDDETGEELPPPPSDNVIDVAVWPRILDEGAYPLTVADDRTLCRRMALDLWGRLPTPDEYADLCEDQAPIDMAWSFMEDPQFAARETRLWFRLVGTDSPDIYSHHLPDADAIYVRLSTGEISYDQFAGELLAHPVLAISRPEADEDDPTFTIHQAFRLFLGRPAQGDELAQFTNLMRVWNRGWEERPGPGGQYKRPAYLDASVCEDPVYDDALCSAELFGVETVMDLAGIVPENVPPEGWENSLDGVFYFEMVHGGGMPEAIQAELVEPGLLLATRDEFWDEAGERALSRLLGWWRSTVDEPDSTLPEVRLALGAWWQAHESHDIRELYAEVLTSLLYTTSAEVDDDIESRSLWSVGPTRLMEGEQYLDSLAVALQRELGFCDLHTADAIGQGTYDDVLREPQPAHFYGFGEDVYFDWGQKLGGCVGGDAVPRQPGLQAVFAHTEVADVLCAPPSVLAPDGFDASDTSVENRSLAIEHLYEVLLTREPEAAEWEVLDAAGEACLADVECSESGLDGFLREMCGAIIRSGEYVFY